jgi:hypothetical protein
MIAGFGGIFMTVKTKPKFAQTEALCSLQEVFVKFLYRSDKRMPHSLRETLP